MHGCTQCACSLSGFSTPYPPVDALEGCTAVALMAEHDDAKQASGQCACACGALTRVRRACLWRAQRACATPLPQAGPEQGAAHVDSVPSQCVLPALLRRRLSMLTRCTRLHWPRRRLPICQHVGDGLSPSAALHGRGGDGGPSY